MTRRLRFVSAGVVLTVALTAFTGHGTAAAVGEGCDGWMMAMPNANLEMDNTAPQSVEYWCEQGPDAKGVDRALGWSHGGANNAYIEAGSTSAWNELSQNIVVPNLSTIEVAAYVATTPNIQWSYIGVRERSSGAEYARRWIGAVGGRQPDGSVRYERMSVLFRPNLPRPAGEATYYTVYIGYISPGGYSEMLVDDVDSCIVGTPTCP